MPRKRKAPKQVSQNDMVPPPAPGDDESDSPTSGPEDETGTQSPGETQSSSTYQSSVGSDGTQQVSPGSDMSVASYDTLSVINAVKGYMKEAENGRYNRDQLTKRNHSANLGHQDYSNKMEGQSTDFIPKVTMALEQIAAFIKHGLVSYGNYFSVDLSPSTNVVGGILSEGEIVRLLRHRLESESEIPPGCQDFPTTIADGIKTAGLGSLFILKVHGMFVPVRRLSIDSIPMDQLKTDDITGIQYVQHAPAKDVLRMDEGSTWRLVIENVRPEDYFPDPTGRGLYEIHVTRKDLHDIVALAESGYYNRDAVEELVKGYGSSTGADISISGMANRERELERQTGQRQGDVPSFRKIVTLWEFWGTILDSDSQVAYPNCVCTIADGKCLIKKPEPNPYWHQESPFVTAPLLRVPFSVWHKALFDHPSELNFLYNQVFNLIMDSSIGAVWGVKQVRKSWIENMDDFTNGIPWGSTIFLTDDAPDNIPAIEQLQTGKVPSEAWNALQLVDSEFQKASLISDTRGGNLPKKDVRATEIQSADQSSSVLFDSIIGDIERKIIGPALRLAWMTMLQNSDDWNAEDVIGILGPDTAKNFHDLGPARRYMQYAQGTRFTVNGLSSIMARQQNYQKLMAFIGILAQTPILMQAWVKKYSGEKLLGHILKVLNLNPDDMALNEEEKAMLAQTMQEISQFSQIAKGAQGDQQTQLQPQQQPGNPVQQVQSQVNTTLQSPTMGT